MNLLELHDVHKSFATRTVLRGLSFDVGAGEIFGMLGPNGAGKSTTFKLICNQLVPDRGRVSVAGTTAADAGRQVLGVVSQNVALYKNLSCGENLSFFGALYGLRGAKLRQRVQACLADVQLADRESSLVRNLSGGMQRRLHLAIALVHEPRLLILDEPSAGLDVEARREMWALLRRLQAAERAILLTTHLLDEAEALCSRIGVLQSGSLLAVGTPEALRSRIDATEIASVQSPELNAVVDAATRHGLQTRRHEHEVAIWLPRRLELSELLALLSGVPVNAISRRPVTLEDAYVEVVASSTRKTP